MCKFADDKLFQETFAQRVDRIVFTYDPASTVNDLNGDNSSYPYWKLTLKSTGDIKDLIVTINLNKFNSDPHGSEQKLDEVLELF